MIIHVTGHAHDFPEPGTEVSRGSFGAGGSDIVIWLRELRCRRETNKQALNKSNNARVHSSLGSYNCQGRLLLGNGLPRFSW